MKICISIAPTTMAEATTKLKLAGRKADLVEVRIDGLRNIDLLRLLKISRPPVIITNRRESEGGMFVGTNAVQFEILSQAAQHGAEYVDVELSWGREFIQSLIQRYPKTKFIVSYHNFENTPDNMESIYQKMCATNADVLKVTTMAKDISDCKRIFHFTSRIHKQKKKIIALCMGEHGQITRILTGKYGGFITFASLEDNNITAPGQLSIDDLKKIYRIDTFSHLTKLFGLVGNPVSHSKGIFFHNAIFRRNKINAVYLNFLVDHLDRFIHAFRDDIHGFSVTMPFKQEIIKHLDRLEGATEELQVVNTVLIKKGKLYGYNTDALAIESLLKAKTKLKNKRVVVMGTGGTAKAMAYVVISSGADTTIVGRSASKAKALANELGCSWTSFDQLKSLTTDILMNGTSVGMQLDESSRRPETDSRLVPKNFLNKGMFVFDAVYNPPMTTLLKQAKAAGCNIITGLELFNRQAELQSKLFLRHIS